ncbi:acyltransferase family protein [Prevotella sp. PINT]|jgi:Fucose 4-O-acetylase and related acetyltransferases|uniref:acyltransferase family protein n=1 Tax=Palleniella intestinalis TaxID=2736291 RepID=UPI0015558E63|nr:acyltransferase family protein [Palleniella intestinalis]NPD81353.1 acyltransferase family protein [Palleniella intestinalis]
MKKVRLHYLDVAKGILMTCLLFHHCANIMGEVKIQAELIEHVSAWNIIFLVFFMQAFFTITGYCTNFDKEFKTYFITNIKTLVVPAIFFTFIQKAIGGFEDFYGLQTIFKYIFDNISVWFLWALFYSKIIYWYVRKMPYKGLIMLSLLCIGGLMKIHIGSTPCFIENTFLCAFFLWIGEKLKQVPTVKCYTIVSLIFFITLSVLLTMDMNMPIVTAGISIETHLDILLYVWLSTTGTMAILLVSKFINKNDFLELIGRHTLVIYGFQAVVLRTVLKGVSATHLFAFDTKAGVLLLYIIVSIGCLLLCLGISLLLNNWYVTRLLIGKNK